MTLIDASEQQWHVPAFTLGDRLVKARTDAGITQERMGELLGCSRRTIVRHESSGHVPRSVVLAYHVATQTDLGWLETGIAGNVVHPLGLEPRTHCFREGAPAEVIAISEAPSRRMLALAAGKSA